MIKQAAKKKREKDIEDVMRALMQKRWKKVVLHEKVFRERLRDLKRRQRTLLRNASTN